MKHSVLSLAVFAALATAGAVHAQRNVQVDGVVDAGIEELNHANAVQNNENGTLVGLSRHDAAFGNSQTGVSVGIRHRFKAPR